MSAATDLSQNTRKMSAAKRRVHQDIAGLEDRLKLECREVYKVLIHPEPETDNHR